MKLPSTLRALRARRRLRRLARPRLRPRPTSASPRCAAKEKPALLETLKQLVSIESGSRDLEGLDKIANLIADKFKALGGQVELIDPTAEAYRMEDTPEKIGKVVRATFKGTGTKKIMLIAHMDTVYQIGMLNKQPFRIDGDKAYGLGIADDKQGVAVITHVVALLKALDFKEYGTLTVLINGDEEISSPGSRALHHPAGRRARRRDVLRRRLDQGRQALARHRGHRLGLAQRHGQGLARGLGARAGRERAVRAVAPDPADARPVRPGHRPEDELDHLARRAPTAT